MAKWNNIAGPRKSKGAVELLKALSAQTQTHKEITGVHGGGSNSMCYWSPFGGTVNQVAADEMTALGEKYSWTLANENLEALEKDATAAIERAKAACPVKDSRITQEEHAARIQRMAKQNAERDAAIAAHNVTIDQIMAKKPAWAHALIVACLDEDKSDMMSDYFAHHTTRHVAIGWRSGTKEDFRQLRRAAATFAETAHLGPDCDVFTVRAVYLKDSDDGYKKAGDYTVGDLDREQFSTLSAAEQAIATAPDLDPERGYKVRQESIEHRDNYSMGSGNYLKAGSTNSSGWRVRSRSLPLSSHDNIEDALPAESQPEQQAADAAPSLQGVSGTITFNDDKGGIEIRFPGKPETAILDRLKANGWRWSRFSSCWYAKRSESAETFAKGLLNL